jgi:hypothetical protein
MRLNKYHIERFIHDVMADLPQPAAKAKTQAIADYRKAVEDTLPDDVKPILKKYPHLFERKAMYVKGWETFSGGMSSNMYVSVVLMDGKLPFMPDVEATQAPYSKEFHARTDLRRRLTDVASKCQTLAKLQEAFPELIKYMPEFKEPPKLNLPVAAGGVVADLFKSGLPAPTKIEVPRRKVKLSAKDMQAVQNAVDNPPAPNEALKKAAKTYRAKVKPNAKT